MRVIICDRCGEQVSLADARHITVHQPDGRDEGYDFCAHCLNEIVEWMAPNESDQRRPS